MVRVESLLTQSVAISDRSDMVTERPSFHDPKIQVIEMADAFGPDDTLIGVGKPNVYLIFPPADEASGLQGDNPGSPIRFAAKSLKRADSKLENTKGRIQSGVKVVLNKMTPEMKTALWESAKEHEGTRQWTCVNANCRVLQDAGFQIGDENMEKIYLPIQLLRKLFKKGIQFKGEEVEYELVRTTPHYLERYGLRVANAVGTTPCRHGSRACNDIKDKSKIVATLVKLKDSIKSGVGVILHRRQQSNEVEALEEQPVYFDTSLVPADDFSFRVSQPSRLGVALRLLWGPHSLFEVSQNDVNIDEYLGQNLKEFPQEDKDFVTKLKQNVLFSKPVVKFIRSQLSRRYQEIPEIHEGNLFEMLRTSSDELPNRYNIVVIKDGDRDRIVVTKLDIKFKYVDWIMVKHVLMSEYAENVRFAGEVWKAEDGTVYVNNNSGTYRPTAEELAGIVNYFRAIFPNVRIKGVDAAEE